MRFTSMTVLLISLFSFSVLFGAANLLSQKEQEEINSRLKSFYRLPADPAVMSQPAPYYSPAKKQFVALVHHNTDFKSKQTPEEFQKAYCEKIVRKHMPQVDCSV